MGLSSFFHTGTWLSGFEKTIYQSLFVGPEIIVRLGSIEGLNVYGVCELTRSLLNRISDTEKTIDLFLRNSSYKFAIELKAKNQKSTWYTGAYYRLIESSLGRETSDDVAKPGLDKTQMLMVYTLGGLLFPFANFFLLMVSITLFLREQDRETFFGVSQVFKAQVYEFINLKSQVIDHLDRAENQSASNTSTKNIVISSDQSIDQYESKIGLQIMLNLVI